VSQVRPAARRGFALLIVVTLLAFIVLLLVGLAAYTRIESPQQH
jgi:type II secretory pathway component PulK